MNKLYKESLLLAAIFIFVFIPSTLLAQQQKAQYSADDLKSIKEQVEQLISMFQFTINTLGDNGTTPKEKEIIITESFQKLFVDEEVQIEDDLDENRTNLINKDVQAYLKDITFFYKNVKFTYNIQSIEPNYTESGDLYFLVSTNRNLTGTNISKKEVNNNKKRFIEVNYNDQERDVRIASVYTTKLNEDEENKTWWNGLTQAWKDVFGIQYMLGDTIGLNEIYAFSDTWVVTRTDTFEIIKYDTILVYDVDTLFINEVDTVPASIKDTIQYDTEMIYTHLAAISNMKELSIENNERIYNLVPLRLLGNLRYLNCSGTKTRDLTPIRNLGKLEKLDLSNTLVKDISPLKYSINLRTLILDDNDIHSLASVGNFTQLEILHFSNTQVDSLQPLSTLENLKDLRFTATPVKDLSPISNLEGLQLLNCSETRILNLNDVSSMSNVERLYAEDNNIQDLSPLAGLVNLQTLYLDNTLVRDLEPLSGMESLKKIYCDNSMVSAETANNFMANNPEILVIFESAALISWWNGLNPDWQLVFSEYVSVDPEPTKEQLSEVSTLADIDISHNGRINDLEPLKELRMLERLDMSFTTIESLDPLNDLVDMTYLNAKGSNIQDLYPVRDLIKLEFLDASVTRIESVEALSDLDNLKKLNVDSTNIQSLVALQELKSIQLVYCDRTSITVPEVIEFNQYQPECLVIYQSIELKSWWDALSGAWKEVFHQALEFEDPPGKIDLHQISTLEELDLSDNKAIQSLSAIAQFMHLKTLKLNHTQINSLSPLNDLKQLEHLEFANNPVADLTPVSNMNRLRHLDMSNTPVEDLEPLQYMAGLETLNCSGTSIKNLKIISNLVNLKRLSIYNTRVNNLKPLIPLPKLEHLECYNTKLSSKKVDEFRSYNSKCEVIFY